MASDTGDLDPNKPPEGGGAGDAANGTDGGSPPPSNGEPASGQGEASELLDLSVTGGGEVNTVSVRPFTPTPVSKADVDADAAEASGPDNAGADESAEVTAGAAADDDVAIDADPGPEPAEVDLDDIEEIDDLEELDVEFEAVNEGTVGAPPTPPAPPPTPKPPAPPPTPVAVKGAPQSPPADDDSDVAIDVDSPDEDAADPAPAAEEAPLETQLEVPTVLDTALADIGEAGLEARASRLAGELEAATDKALIGALSYELGELYERRLADEARAVKAYGRALQADPSLRPNLWAIRRVFYRRGLWPNLLKLVDAEIRFAANDLERADLLVEKGNLLEDRLEQHDEAKACYEKAHALDPSSMRALMSLERMALADGDNDTKIRVWTALAEAATTPQRKLAYLLDLIDAHAEAGPDGIVEAREIIANAVALAVDVDRVAKKRLHLAEAEGDSHEILSALEARVAVLQQQFGPAGPPDPLTGPRDGSTPLDRAGQLRLQMVALRRRQARVCRELAEDPERAWDYLQQALALAPGEPLLLADLADLAEQLGRYGELAELVQGWESMEGDPSRALALSIRRADALLRGGQREQGIALLDSLASQAPGYIPLTALLERDALVARDFARLADAYAGAGAAAALGTSFGPGTEAEPNPIAAAAYYVAAGDLRAMFVGDDDEARAHYARALEASRGYPAALEALTSLHEAAGRLDDAAQLLELHIDAAEGDYKQHLLERLARVYEDNADLEQLLGALRRLREVRPDDSRIAWRLEQTLSALGRSAERASLLVSLAEGVDDPTRRGAALFDAARIYDEQLDEAGKAADLYRQVLEIWPGDRYARAALVALLRRAERWDDLVAERKAEAAQLDDGPTLVRALREAADVMRRKLGDTAGSRALYRELLDRMPGQLDAVRGLVATARELDDADALIDALEAQVEAANSPLATGVARLHLAGALERAGRHQDAIDAYRGAMEVAATPALATFAIAELSADVGDTNALIDALTAMAGSGSPALQAVAHEHMGWLWTLVLGDFDRAAASFAEACAADASRVGARVGSALVSAKRGDVAEVGEALSAMAGALTAPGSSSAMYLRAAAIADVGGDPDTALAHVRNAITVSSDDAANVVVAAEYIAGVTPEEIAGLEAEAVRDLCLTRADLFSMRAAIAGTPAARDDWELERAEALESAGRLRESADIVASVLGQHPKDIRALQALRRLCRRGGDRASLARASLALARVIGDSEGKLALYREAVGILDHELNDVHGAVPVYRRILAEEPGADEYDRLRELLRQHGDISGLVESITARINWHDQSETDAGKKVPLLLERGKLRNAIGDERGGSRDFAALLDIDDANAEALALQAAYMVKKGDATAGAKLFERYLEVEVDPRRRAEAELELSQILAEDIGDVTGAVRQLEHVVQQSPTDIDVRERLVALLMRASEYDRAVREIREVEKLRKSASERARDELRVAAIFREQLADPKGARQALTRARQLDPVNVDAVRELAELVASEGDAKGRRQVLAHAASDARTAVAESPGRAALYERLAVIANWLDDADARYFALAALDALGSLSAEQTAFVGKYNDQRVRAMPARAIAADEWRMQLALPQSESAASELWQVIAEAVARSLDIDAGKLGFARGDRQSAKNLARNYSKVAAVMEAFGVTAADVYVSESKPAVCRVISSAKPVLCLGADVARLETNGARFLLGRAVAQLRDRTGTLAELRPDELTMFFAAAAGIAGVNPAPPALAAIAADAPAAVDQRHKQLSKHLGRREKKNLALVAGRFSEIGDPLAWREAAISTASRAGLLLSGDVAVALDVLDVGRGGRSLVDEQPVLDLLAWAAGDAHLALRKALGLSTQ